MGLESQELASQLSVLLQHWRDGLIDERHVHETAEAIFESVDWHDVPKEHAESVPIEVLSQLEILNQQLIVPQDVPAMLSFLELGAEDPVRAWSAWEQYWEQVDLEERKRNLRGSKYYAV